MRKYLNVLFLILISTVCLAQQDYKVTAKTFLNVRSNPHAEAQIMGTIDKGEKVSVYETEGNWAKIAYKGGYGYVSRDYIRPVTKTNVNEIQKPKADELFLLPYIKSLHFPSVGRPFIYFILGISAILFIIRFMRREDPLEGTVYPINWILFLLVSIMEIVYVISLGTEAIWFCMPGEVGWLWTVINFFIFGFVVYNQLMCLMNTLEDIQCNSGAYCDLRLGIYSWPIAVVLMIICGFFYQPGILITGILLLIAQVVQIGIILKIFFSASSGWGYAILCAVVYLIGSVATVLILAHFLVLLVIVLIGFFILYIIGKIGESSTKESNERCSNCSHYSGESSGSHCYYRSETIYNPSTTSCSHHS